jgi:GAF domain-containing protein
LTSCQEFKDSIGDPVIDWALAKIRNWIAIRLIVGDSVLGLLSIGESHPRSFTNEHFRLAKSLAIPAAVAIHNARLYEWAQIYAAERESLLKQADSAHSSDPTRRGGLLQSTARVSGTEPPTRVSVLLQDR